MYGIKLGKPTGNANQVAKYTRELAEQDVKFKTAEDSGDVVNGQAEEGLVRYSSNGGRHDGRTKALEFGDGLASEGVQRAIAEIIDGRGKAPSVRRADSKARWEPGREITEIAKRNGCFVTVEDFRRLIANDYRRPDFVGGEHQVWKSKDGNFVVKLNGFFGASERGEEPYEVFNRYAVHNNEFENCQYEILGFTELDRTPYLVVRQQFVVNAREATQEEIDRYFAIKGFAPKGSGVWEREDGVIASDVVSNNVLVNDNGDVFVIDANLYSQSSNNDVHFKTESEESGIKVSVGKNVKTGKSVDFIDLMARGIKKGETRDFKKDGSKPSLPVGKWVGMYRDYDEGIVLRVKFGEPVEIRKGDANYKKAFIKDTDFDIKDGGSKWYYPIVEMQDLRDNPQPINKPGNYVTYDKRPDMKFKTHGIYTGSAADYDKPSLLKVGTGEGSQVYGWGLYGSNQRGVAETYARIGRDALSLEHVMYDGKPLLLKGDSVEVRVGADIKHEGFDVDKLKKTYKSRLDNAIRELGEFKKLGLDTDFQEEMVSNYKEYYDFIVKNGDKFEKAPDTAPGEHVYEQTWFTNRAPGDEFHLLKWYEPVSQKI